MVCEAKMPLALLFATDLFELKRASGEKGGACHLLVLWRTAARLKKLDGGKRRRT
jgi:hypothetical protein